jgi:hypothetical protein
MRRPKLDVPDIKAFFDKFSQESDRAAGILGGALLDLHLERLFRARLAADTPEAVYGNRGPLGDFASRIDLAYALGWIDADTKNDLHIVRGIRNDFAHHADHELTFSDQSISDRARNFSTSRYLTEFVAEIVGAFEGLGDLAAPAKETLANIADPRPAFSITVSLLAGVLLEATRRPRVEPPDAPSLRSHYDRAIGEMRRTMLAAAEMARRAIGARPSS